MVYFRSHGPFETESSHIFIVELSWWVLGRSRPLDHPKARVRWSIIDGIMTIARAVESKIITVKHRLAVVVYSRHERAVRHKTTRTHEHRVVGWWWLNLDRTCRLKPNHHIDNRLAVEAGPPRERAVKHENNHTKSHARNG